MADFAPAKRARLGGNQIAAALEADPDFRSHVATQVALVLPALSEWVEQGQVPQAADPVDTAVVLWLKRPQGWEEAYTDALRGVQVAGAPQDNSRLGKLEARLAKAEQATRDLKSEHRARIDEIKAENTALRRKLGEARATLRGSGEEAQEQVRQAQERAERAEAERATAEAELRRVKATLAEAQSQLGAVRSEARTERDATALRARLLLDTLLEAGQGLRRELALPAVSGSPGEHVEAEVAAAGTREPSSAGALGPASPALLEQHLAMPRARLIIDGYNVSKSAWPTSSLEAQRVRLLTALGPVVARSGAETTVVFDAASQSHRGVANAPRGVKVLFSPEGVIADDVIRDLVAAEPQGRVVVVVTSDQEIVRDVRRNGARAVASAALIALLGG
ncbi:NYN domain-containing protein [Nocardioides sp. AE5]|uniref:NYN domain-containing protein n=1 Tax=Nocardioides sp. AE5 TaxID=2962573 RepID=UPI0028827795|nr:NYN domain-containing protein [Nocardioides sp. AE5]MDT0201192.1 NYN domain-containing protein [Nocardioides sp. AE5]